MTSSELLFSMILAVTKTYQIDHLTLFDTMLKTVLARLDVRPYNHVAETLRLVKETVLVMDFINISDAVQRNLKFQVDQLVPNLQTVFLDSKTGSKSKSIKTDSDSGVVRLSKDHVDSYTSCLQLLQAICQVDDSWAAQVATVCKSAKMAAAFNTYVATMSDRRSWLTVEFMFLAKILAESESGWRKVLAEMVADRDKIGLVSEALKAKNVGDGAVVKKALGLLSLAEVPETCFVATAGEAKEDDIRVAGEET